ncbi:hypothetical protein L7F22_062675 [Adiantum nelumboides]|nr:hypothetical protein [Adiantum nelumboides]
MCGILAVLCCQDSSLSKRSRVLELSRRLRHRGPDWSGLCHHGNHFMAHERLAIIDPASGDQPLFDDERKIVVTVNGEIYNHEALKAGLKQADNFRTQSDCEVLAHLYKEVGEEMVSMLDGMYSFVLLDTRDNSFIAARDPIGITPLYIGWGVDGSVWFASEMKALKDDCEQFQSFPPGHIYSSKAGALRRYYEPQWFSEAIPSAPYDPLLLRKAFEKAVVKRLMTDVPFGVLLSGGLDSSLVASVACRYIADTKAGHQWGSRLHSFCVGLKGSPDLKAAKEVADYLGTLHTEFHFTVQEGLDAIPDVIYHIETYDVTTIRASTPMFLMSRKIKALGVKMVLSGEGSDELFGGYLYFHKAPNKEEFHKETCRKVKDLHLYDCLRANKSTAAWGVEARVPFLDKEFINVALGIDPAEKMIQPKEGRIEKWILRNAFDVEEKPYLPKVWSCFDALNSSRFKGQLAQGEKGYESFFGYRMDGNKEEGSSSEDRQPIPTAHEIGESSGQAEKALQVVTAVTMFKQLMENPRFMEFIQSSSIAHQVQGSFGMPGIVFRGMQGMVPNPMYADIGLHPRFQGTQDQFGVSQGNLGMAGFSIPSVNMTPGHQHVTGQGVQMAPTGVHIMQTVSFDNLESMDKPKPYKEDDQSVQFDTFSGFDERKKYIASSLMLNYWLSQHILYRQKEQFSDGVGYSWIDGIKAHAEKQVSDQMMANASFIYPYNTPTTKEAYFYRRIFEGLFPQNSARATVPGGPSVACSTAKALEWDEAWSKNPDPSGRAAIGIHEAAYKKPVTPVVENVGAGSYGKMLKLEESIPVVPVK